MQEKKSILDIQINAKQAVDSMDKINDQLYELNLKQREIEKSSWKTKKQLQESNAEYAENAAKIKVLNQEMQGYKKQLENQVKTQRENEGSLTSMRAELSNLRKTYDQLAQTDREGAIGTNLLEQISMINNALTEAEEKSGRFQRNVGNYYGAIMAAGRDLLSGGGATRPTGPMGGEGGPLNTESLKKQKRELTELMQQMKFAGLQGTKEFDDISKSVGDLKDTIGDLEAETTHYASDTAKLDEMRAGFDVTQDAVSGVSSAMETFGVESEGVALAEQRLSSASMAVNSAISVQNALQRQSALMLGIKRIQELAAAKATKLLADANGKATLAQKAFNMVAKANPYVLLATAILSVVGAIGAYILATQKADTAQKAFNRTLAEYQKKNREIENERKKSENAAEIRNMQDVIAENPVETATREHSEAMKKWENTQEKYLDLSEKVRKIGIEQGDDSEEYKKASEDLKTLEEDLEEASNLVDEKVHDISKAEIQMNIWDEEAARQRAEDDAERRKEELEKQKEANEKALNEQRTAQDLEIANMKDGFDKQRKETTVQYKRTIEDLRVRLKSEEGLNTSARSAINKQIVQNEEALRKALAKIDAEERTATLNREKEIADARLETMKEGDEQYLNAKIDALHKEMAVELDNAELTEQQKALIRAKYKKQEAEERANFQDEQIDSATAKQTTSDELELARMQANGSKQSDILKKQSEQMFNAFATMQKKNGESESEFQLRTAQAYNDAMAKKKEADEQEKAETEDEQTKREAKIQQYNDLADGIGNVTSALTEGTSAEKDAKKVSAGLALVTSGMALAEGIEKASKQEWPLNIAAIASVLGEMLPVISNIKTLAGYANGGLVLGAGSGTSDSINARLSNGEYVVKASAVNQSTLPILNAMNGQATGAQVGNNNFLAQQMIAALQFMPSPIVSVQDINKGQSRVQVVESSAKMF